MANSENNFFSRNRIWLSGIALLMLVAFGIYLWKQHELQELREAQALKEQQLIEDANKLIDENDTRLLQSLMQPLSWSVRSEMLRNNLEQVEGYLAQFVQQPQFDLALVTNANDTVVVSTNQKHISKPLSQFFPSNYGKNQQVTTYPIDSTHLMVVSPIMGYNNRLGTLLVSYEQRKFVPATLRDSL